MADGDFVFLGFCERADHNSETGQWNILNLGHVLFGVVYPITPRILLGFSIADEAITREHKLQIVNDNNAQIGTLNLNTNIIDNPTVEDLSIDRNAPMLRVLSARSVIFVPLNNVPNILFDRPGHYRLQKLEDDGTITELGSLYCNFVPMPKPSPERLMAIKSDPNAAKAVKIHLACKKCPSKFFAYASVDRDDAKFESHIWYEQVPDRFLCACGRTDMDLSYVRQNLASMLGQPVANRDALDILSLTEKSSLTIVRNKFLKLLNSSPAEQSLQEFIQENPILLHQFPAIKIIPKPPILTHFKADFAVLTAQKELIFIELEKADTRLMNIKGHRAAPLIHAYDQVRDWLNVIKEHRIAVLDQLNIQREEVNVIKGLVIAGREGGYDAQRMRKFKMNKEENIEFLTYDDLLFSLDALTEKL